MVLFARCYYAFFTFRIYVHVELYSILPLKSRAMMRDYFERHRTLRPVPRDSSKRMKDCDETVDMFFETHVDTISQ